MKFEDLCRKAGIPMRVADMQFKTNNATQRELIRKFKELAVSFNERANTEGIKTDEVEQFWKIWDANGIRHRISRNTLQITTSLQEYLAERGVSLEMYREVEMAVESTRPKDFAEQYPPFRNASSQTPEPNGKLDRQISYEPADIPEDWDWWRIQGG